MISFPRLGTIGRLGNQLFQYAFLRSTAERLGVKFHCPPWIGDRAFRLDDGDVRVEHADLPRGFRQQARDCGFTRDALDVIDGTEIHGYFQSERYFIAPEVVRGWFAFREEVRRVERRYTDTDFSRAVSLHLRFGDMLSNPLYYQPRLGYYRAALARVREPSRVLVFSDDTSSARRVLRGLAAPLTFVEGNHASEDLYLMSRCRDHICSVSTLSWWGAWLDPNPDKRVVVPREGALRPGAPVVASAYWCDGWLRERALLPLLDRYRVHRFLLALRRRRRRWSASRQQPHGAGR